MPKPAKTPPPANPNVQDTTMGSADTAMLYMFPTTPTAASKKAGLHSDGNFGPFNKVALELRQGDTLPAVPKHYGGKITGIQLFKSTVPQQQTQLNPAIGAERSGIAGPTGIQQLTHPLTGLPTL